MKTHTYAFLAGYIVLFGMMQYLYLNDLVFSQGYFFVSGLCIFGVLYNVLVLKSMYDIEGGV